MRRTRCSDQYTKVTLTVNEKECVLSQMSKQLTVEEVNVVPLNGLVDVTSVRG